MKKTLAMVLALSMVLSLCLVFASAEETTETEEPSSYLWFKADSTYTPFINFQVDGSLFSNKKYCIRANVYFGDDCTGSGTVADNSIYVNCYSYSDATKFNDFAYLINYADFAKYSDETAVIGGWKEYSLEFNPFEVTYSGGTSVAATNGIADTVGLISIGMGFWNATGTIKVASLFISEVEGGNPVWSKNFATGLDPATDTDIYNYELSADKQGTYWDVVVPPAGSAGNLAIDATATYPAGYKNYNASLNDGVAPQDKDYGLYYGFYHNGDNPGSNITIETIEGTEYFVGTVVFDFGEVKAWNKVRANVWDGAGDSGIASPGLILVSYSDNGTDWTEAGDLLLGTAGEVYWAEKEFDTIASQYCKVQVCWASGGVFVFLNEIEIISADVIISDESSAAVSEEASTGTETSSDTPKTGDTGVVTLAIISVIALAGAVVIKRKK